MRLLMAPLLALLASGCDRQSAPTPQPKAPQAIESAAEPESTGELDISHRGEAAPNVSFEGPHGESTTIASFRGKPLLVNLWATWCGPCVAEMPTLDALSARRAEKLQVIVVSQDGEGRVKVGPWWAQRSFARLKPYLDPKSNLGFAFATGMVPTTVLYDGEGREVWRVIGSMNWDGPRANTLLAETLGDQE